MKISEMYPELKRRNKLLAQGGLLFLLLFVVSILLSLVDHRTVLGINTWIKPMKFTISIWIYLWTIGWLMDYLPGKHNKAIRWISVGIFISMLIEMICIGVQAARGVRSHFNIDTKEDAMVFILMGIIVMLNTVLMIVITYLFFRKVPHLSRSFLFSIRAGLIFFLVASVVGGYMSGQMAHSVGAADGGAGLPILNWSTRGGDLRIAHFIGLHALQILPIFACWIERKQGRRKNVMIPVFCIVYGVFILFLFSQAMRGMPFLNWS